MSLWAFFTKGKTLGFATAKSWSRVAKESSTVAMKKS
jgi:hypothetical protein